MNNYFCHCNFKAIESSNTGIRNSHRTKVDKQGICLFCGYYAVYGNDNMPIAENNALSSDDKPRCLIEVWREQRENRL